MKKLLIVCVLVAAAFAECVADENPFVKAAWFEAVISPEIGVPLAGYGSNAPSGTLAACS